jgi:release factor glutamine methyltransferase
MSYVCRMTIQEATYFILNQLRKIYPEGEASQITDWLMEHVTGSKKVERMVYKNDDISETEEVQLKKYLNRLLQHEPIQYILNEAWFG